MINSRPVFQILLALVVLPSCNVHSQSTSRLFTFQNFEKKILAYEPVQQVDVTDKKFQKGKFYLSETRSATENDPKNLNVADYWNITMAFLSLQEPKAHIEIAFQKAVEADPEAICSYITHLGKARLDEHIPEVFIPFYQSCSEHTTGKKEDQAGTASDPNLDAQLLSLMNRVNHHDQQYRGKQKNMEQQKTLDLQNQAVIDSMYQVYHTYIGRSLVGEQLEYTMWAVIQHSDLDMMERYLPVVVEAVREGELSNPAPLKMLIDRVYWLKYGYQIFGSQQGVDLADDGEVESVHKKYGLK